MHIPACHTPTHPQAVRQVSNHFHLSQVTPELMAAEVVARPPSHLPADFAAALAVAEVEAAAAVGVAVKET